MATALRTVLVDSDAAARARLGACWWISRRSRSSASTATSRRLSRRPRRRALIFSSSRSMATSRRRRRQRSRRSSTWHASCRKRRSSRWDTGSRPSSSFASSAPGALEFLRRPLERVDLVAALEKLARFRGSAPQRNPGRIISVFAAKGGLGATTLAINLAVSMAERAEGKTLLVELDTRQSDIVTFLDPSHATRSTTSSRTSAAWMSRCFGPPDGARERTLDRARADAARSGQFSPDQVSGTIEVVRSHFDHVLMDLRHDFDPGTVAALEASDVILFVTSLDVATLRSGAAALCGLPAPGPRHEKDPGGRHARRDRRRCTVKHARTHPRAPHPLANAERLRRTVVASINRAGPWSRRRRGRRSRRTCASSRKRCAATNGRGKAPSASGHSCPSPGRSNALEREQWLCLAVAATRGLMEWWRRRPTAAAPRSHPAGSTLRAIELKTRVHRQLIERLDLAKLVAAQRHRAAADPTDRRGHARCRRDTPEPAGARGPGPRGPARDVRAWAPSSRSCGIPPSPTSWSTGPRSYVERRGKLERTNAIFRDDAHLLQIIDRIVSAVGRRVDESSPMVDARLPDGSRVNAIIPPLALDGPVLSIRRFAVDPLKMSDLVDSAP